MTHSNNHSHDQSHSAHESVGGDKHVLAVKAVGYHTAERRKQALRQHGAQRGERQHER